MKVSVNWVKELTDIDIDVNELVEKIGAQLGAVDEVINLGERYEGIIIVQVVSCVPHLNADTLKVCLVDDGRSFEGIQRNEDGFIQIVCGAPNVEEGQLVAWLPPGSIVPSSFTNDPFKLETREIRGVKSNGMLASASELNIGEDHSGLLVLDKGKPGDSFAKTYKLDDHIIDIENKMLTHRPDCFGMLGIAREITGILGKKFTSPKWYINVFSEAFHPSASTLLPLVVDNQLPELVPRFMAIPLSNVSFGDSPVLLRTYLSRVGVRPINNIVDITNFMMLLTAQPLHAYDYDKVRALDENSAAAKLTIRYPHEQENLKLLNGKEVILPEKAIVISSATKAIGIGGISGGTDTEVDHSTKNIILECATFDMYNIRRTSMELGLFTDAVTRFTKGQSPLQNDRVLAETVMVVKKTAGGNVAAPVIDDAHNLPSIKKLNVPANFINDRLGTNLYAQVMATLLENVEFKVGVLPTKLESESLDIEHPFWRTDIEIPEDIVEEVGRLYGYDHLELELPKRNLKPADRNKQFDLRSEIRRALAGAGANEALTYSFVHGELLHRVSQDTVKAVQLSNALSPDLQFFRMSIVPSLLDKVYPNIRADIVRDNDNEFALFEINNVLNSHDRDEDNLPKEIYELGFVFAADKKTAERKYSGSAFYEAKRFLNYLCEALYVPQDSLSIIKFESVTSTDDSWVEQAKKPYEAKRSGVIVDKEGKIWGVLGEFRSSVKQSLKLPNFCAGFDLNTAVFLQRGNKTIYQPLSKFPKVVQDISLRTPAATAFGDIYKAIQESVEQLKPQHTTFQLTVIDIYQKTAGDDYYQITLRLWISAHDRTLTAEEVNILLDQAAQQAHEKYGVERISSTVQNQDQLVNPSEGSL